MTPEDESFLKELALRAKLQNGLVTIQDVQNTPVYDEATRKTTIELWQTPTYPQCR